LAGLPGSGGTTAGLALGLALSGLSSRTKLHAFCACDSDEYFYNEIDNLLVNMGLSERFKAKVASIPLVPFSSLAIFTTTAAAATATRI